MLYQILLFYKYVPLEDPWAEMVKQKALCKKYNLKCRIILSAEGINGTLEGTLSDTENYICDMVADSRFNDIHWKKSEGTGNAFPKVNIKVRPEIVSLGLGQEDINPNVASGKYITADELHELYESGSEFYVIDMRNDYEQAIGHFEDAYLMPISNFREIPDKLEEISHLKDKLVITTCTGGIRCEKASGFLVKHGFTNVYQLYGGMQTYMEKYPNRYFKGKLYVFDGRITWGVNTDSPEHEVIGRCKHCKEKCDNYVDCSYKHCRSTTRHFVICNSCIGESSKAYCSRRCINLDNKKGRNAHAEWGT